MRGVSLETKRLIEFAYSLLEEDHPMTLRQLHYAIFSRKEIRYDNTQACYKRLSRATTVAGAPGLGTRRPGGFTTCPHHSVLMDRGRDA
jgi:hypothetical protein